jgi:hypothetical protein
MSLSLPHTQKETAMEEELQKIKNWSSRGTLRQFYAEASAKASAVGFKSQLEGDTITFYRSHKEGGFLGIGARTVKEPVLKIIRHDNTVEIPEDGVDDAFVQELAGSLKQH